tara:strand:- start:2004 stop:2207 length:204 start_codon:yes stop_codon:yes gene_type:complete
MNERINGLWWKARIGYNNQNCDPEVLEKFAELIVRECMSVCIDDIADPRDTVELKCAKKIKEHFGVE